MDATIHMLCGVVCVARTMVDAVPLSVPMRSTDDVLFTVLSPCTGVQHCRPGGGHGIGHAITSTT